MSVLDKVLRRIKRAFGLRRREDIIRPKTSRAAAAGYSWVIFLHEIMGLTYASVAEYSGFSQVGVSRRMKRFHQLPEEDQQVVLTWLRGLLSLESESNLSPEVQLKAMSVLLRMTRFT